MPHGAAKKKKLYMWFMSLRANSVLKAYVPFPSLPLNWLRDLNNKIPSSLSLQNGHNSTFLIGLSPGLNKLIHLESSEQCIAYAQYSLMMNLRGLYLCP